eukprot:4368848-Prorocentrum_lima.AAC.1
MLKKGNLKPRSRQPSVGISRRGREGASPEGDPGKEELPAAQPLPGGGQRATHSAEALNKG